MLIRISRPPIYTALQTPTPETIPGRRVAHVVSVGESKTEDLTQGNIEESRRWIFGGTKMLEIVGIGDD